MSLKIAMRYMMSDSDYDKMNHLIARDEIRANIVTIKARLAAPSLNEGRYNNLMIALSNEMNKERLIVATIARY